MKKTSTSSLNSSQLHVEKNQSNDMFSHVHSSQNTRVLCEPNSIISSAPTKAFFGDPTLHSIVIQPEVTEIGDYAFYGCSNLRSVKFNNCNQLHRIGSHAFSHCKSLESIMIPDCVEIIQIGAFKACEALNEVSPKLWTF